MGELYIQYEYWFAATQLALAMFGMGATLTIADFKDVLREPRAVLFGTGIQLLLVPAAAYVFIHTSGVLGGVAIGIALMAAIPGGTTSNIFTFLSRGNSPLSICITGITTLACLVTTPLILSLLINQYLPAEFTMPVGQVISDIALILLLPLVLGMQLLKHIPRLAPNVSKWAIRASLFIILLIVIGSSSAGRLDLEAFGTGNLIHVIIFMSIIAVLGRVVPMLLGLARADCIAIEMEAIVRNANLGVMIKASMFPIVARGDNGIGDMVLLTVLLYGGLQLLVAPALIYFNRRNGGAA